jgi:hypothetical protein
MSSKLLIKVGDDAFKHDKQSEPLIKRVLYRDDVMLLLGSEKAGKSILAQQLAFCCTSGDAFLGKFEVTKPINVAYFQTEGKEGEGVDRRLRMEQVVKPDRSRYAHFYKKFFPIDIDAYRDFLIQGLESLPWKPDLMIIDALYMAMVGDLIDNKEVRKLIANVSYILEKFSLTCVVVHHETKEEFDKDTHEAVDKGDKGSYGSVFLRAWVDHIIYLKKIGPRTRLLKCDTQRSGKMLEKENLVLIGDASSDKPNEPLYFELNEEQDAARQAIIAMIRMKKRATQLELKEMSGLANSTLYKILRGLVTDKKVIEIEKETYELCQPAK